MEIGSLGNENHGNWVLVAQNHEKESLGALISLNHKNEFLGALWNSK
jgi:hypothetical protein